MIEGTKHIALLSLDGYMRQYYEFCQTASSYRIAYEQTEQLLYDTFGVSRYSSYESFRVMKARYIKRQCRQR